ncbi:MAG: hypothetical protein WC835_03795 [Candidatus Paceibacterota bacterium]|jgi:hypothetical protein
MPKTQPSIETVFISGKPVLHGINGGGSLMYPARFFEQNEEDREAFGHLVPNWIDGMSVVVRGQLFRQKVYLQFFKMDGGAKILSQLVLRRDKPIKIKGKTYLPAGDIWHEVFDAEASVDVKGIFTADHIWRGAHNVLLTFISPDRASYSAMYPFNKLRPIFDRDMTDIARERLVIVSAKYLRTLPR